MVKSRKKKITGKFTNAENLKDMFFMNAENRRKAGDKAYGDAADDVGEIKLSANEQIFNQRKQLLINKIQDCINKCQASDSYSIASVCCIQKLEPKHQKELLDLESQARTAETDRIVNGKKNSLLGEYQKFASLFPDGDKDERFYFSRAAPYKIFFPPSLQSYYDKGKGLELENCEILEKEKDLILSDEINELIKNTEKQLDNLIDELETSRKDGDKIDQENVEAEKKLLENERYRDGVRAAENQLKENQNTKAMLTELFGKKNGTIPLKDGETKESIDQQIAILTNTLKQGEDRYNQLLGDLKTMRQQLLGGTNLMKMLGLDKLKTMDKIMLIDQQEYLNLFKHYIFVERVLSKIKEDIKEVEKITDIEKQCSEARLCLNKHQNNLGYMIVCFNNGRLFEMGVNGDTTVGEYQKKEVITPCSLKEFKKKKNNGQLTNYLQEKLLEIQEIREDKKDIPLPELPNDFPNPSDENNDIPRLEQKPNRTPQEEAELANLRTRLRELKNNHEEKPFNYLP
ncbi:14251_t:CDS:2 [Funneliformis geosporum]|nr:14251_t:CDS:2 [Funneliformis geosporum]